MSEPTYSEAHALQKELQGGGRAIKPVALGGPQTADTFTSTNGTATDQEKADAAKEYPNLPQYRFPTDRERDEYMQYKRDLLAQEGVKPQITVGDQEIKYIQDKEAAVKHAQFLDFIDNSIPRGAPWQKAYFEKFRPGYYKDALTIATNRIDEMKELTRMKITGPQGPDDMKLLYSYYIGERVPPKTINGLIAGEKATAASYRHGLFSPLRGVHNHARLVKDSRDFLSNINIPGFDTTWMEGTEMPPWSQSSRISNASVLASQTNSAANFWSAA